MTFIFPEMKWCKIRQCHLVVPNGSTQLSGEASSNLSLFNISLNTNSLLLGEVYFITVSNIHRYHHPFRKLKYNI